jgi:oligopeptide transport system ATP-binding protein
VRIISRINARSMRMSDIILDVRNLKKYYGEERGLLRRASADAMVHAVDGISFNVRTRETMALVGESGCGKTTSAFTILRLLEPTAGEAYFEGKNIFQLGKKEMHKLRREIQMIFQDPFASLNPRMTVYDMISEPLSIHGLAKGDEKKKRVTEMVEKVGLTPDSLSRYPHNFSGGQRQRVGIARALVTNPKFVIADEPVSSIDLSIRAQILNLLQDLQKEFRLSYLIISHDLALVRHICDRVAVMYAGKIVELGSIESIFGGRRHPYTEALLSAFLIPDPKANAKRTILRGTVPSMINLPPGCRFHPRCPYAESICSKIEPELIHVKNEHFLACHLFE